MKRVERLEACRGRKPGSGREGGTERVAGWLESFFFGLLGKEDIQVSIDCYLRGEEKRER